MMMPARYKDCEPLMLAISGPPISVMYTWVYGEGKLTYTFALNLNLFCCMNAVFINALATFKAEEIPILRAFVMMELLHLRSLS